MAKSQTLEIEFDGPKNQSVYFTPIQKRVRGRFDAHRVVDGGRLLRDFPEPVPGQRLQLDLGTGEAAIFEPLHDHEFIAIRERIEESGRKLPEQYERVKADVATWVYWLRGLVDTGLAKVVVGELPAKVEGVPRTRFHSTEQPDPIDRLATAIEKQSEMLGRMLSKLEA